MESTRSVAMGGATAALGTSTTALYDNPANLPFARVYHFEAGARFSPEARRQTYTAAVADSVTNRFSGGLAGSYSILDPDGIARTWTDARLSLAAPLGEAIAIGVAGRYLDMHQAVGKGPFGASLASDGTSGSTIWTGFTADAGITVMPVTGLRMGFIGKNLTFPNNGLLPTMAGGGIGYTTEAFAIEVDSLVDFTTWGAPRPRVGGGVELFLANHVPLRAGYRFDAGQRVQSVTFGLGYIDKKFGIEASGRRDVVADHPMTSMAISLRYFYDAAGTANSIGAMD